MNIIPCDIEGPVIIEPKVFGDARGFFFESWNAASFAAAGLDLAFIQDNHSRSQKGVLRGMHFQLGVHAVVDEAQDIGVPHLRFLAALGAGLPVDSVVARWG